MDKTYQFHTLAADEADSFCMAAHNPQRSQRAFLSGMEAGSVLPEWCWTATDPEGRIKSRLYWWAEPGSTTPFVATVVDDSDSSAVSALLRYTVEQLSLDIGMYPISIPIRETTPVDQFRPRLVAGLHGAGFSLAVERVGLRREGTGEGTDNLRMLTMHSARAFDDTVLKELLASVGDESLDHAMAEDRETWGRLEEASRRLKSLKAYQGDLDWFAIGSNPAGDLVGYAIPAIMESTAIIAEIGVAQPFRGRGYVDDLLCWATNQLWKAGFNVIRADTDLGNVPMREAFRRAGYVEVSRRYDFYWKRIKL